jgi:hypothetical protein
MKKTTILMAIVAGVAMQAMAANTDNSPSASSNTPKNTLQHRIYKTYLQPKTSQTTDKIDRVGGISSRPWAQTAGYSAAGPSLFAGDRERFHDVQFSLFWVGAPPR